MPCYSPNIRLCIKSTGKQLEYINSNRKDFEGYEFYEMMNKHYRTHMIDKEYQKIPCLQCSGCIERNSREWAIRCMFEKALWKENYFITLTYDDDHIPIAPEELKDTRNGVTYVNDGSWIDNTLIPKDAKDFIDDIRDHYRYHYGHIGIRYFGCGEYGSQTQRCHFHIILFNFPLLNRKKWNEEKQIWEDAPADLKVYKVTKDETLFTCDEIQKKWGKGFITIGEVNWDTCAYTARYVMKKAGVKKIPREYFFENGRQPEYVFMSRKPGIGYDYFANKADTIYENDEIIIRGHKEKISPVKPPSFFDKKYDLINHEKMQEIKYQRKKIARRVNETKNAQSSLTEKERLKIEERTKINKMSILKRDAI